MGCSDSITNTDKLIAEFSLVEHNGGSVMRFSVGKNTGNGPSVVAALRRRGFEVGRVPVSGSYEMRRTMQNVLTPREARP